MRTHFSAYTNSYFIYTNVRRTATGQFMTKYPGIIPFGLTMLVFIITLVIGSLIHIAFTVSTGNRLYSPPVQCIGGIMTLCGFAVSMAAGRTLSRARGTSTFATFGVYSHSRNPMYASAIYLIFPGIATVLHNPLMFVAVPPLMRWFFKAHIAVEEAFLQERFGEAYRSYCQRVPQLLPKPFLGYS